MSDLNKYTTWKVPAGWNKIIETWREKHGDELIMRGVNSNSAAVLFILTRVMEADGLVEPFQLGGLLDFGPDFRLKDTRDASKTR